MSTKRRSFSNESRQSSDRYSEDFVSDDDNKKESKNKRSSAPRKTSNHRYYQDKLAFGHGSGSLRNQVHRHGLKMGRGNVRGDSLSSEPADMRKNGDSVATRVLSASRNRINELRNKIEEMKIRNRELEQENKLFKITQFRQEKAIKTFSDKESDLPMILEKHNNEIRALKEQNRRLKEKHDKADRYLRDAEDELERVRKKMNKYKEVCENKELLERDELARKLITAEQEAEDKEIKMKEIQKHLDMLKKSHKHELGIEFARQKDLRKQLDELKEKYSQLVIQLKEKERALGYQNIHSNSHPGKLSRSQSPEGALNTNTKRKTLSMTELTPREKAKYYSEKQRAELHKQKDLKDKQDRKTNQRMDEDKEKKMPSNVSLKTDKMLHDIQDNKLEAKKKDNNDKEDKKSKDSEQSQKKYNDIQKQDGRLMGADKEMKNELKHKKSEQTAIQKFEANDKEKYGNKEKNKTGKQDIKGHGELERRQQFEKSDSSELERRQQFEKSDSFVQKERNKSELLKKLEELDDALHQPVKKNDSQTNGFDVLNDSSHSNYNSLHSTKTLHGDVTLKRLEFHKNKQQQSTDNTNGYTPSFGPTRENINKPNHKTKPFYDDDDDQPAFKINQASQQKDKKPNLLESLFGPQANSSSKNLSTSKAQENIFITSEKSSHLNNQAAATSSTFPWDSYSDKSNFDSNTKPKTMSGSPGIFNINTSDKTNKVTPIPTYPHNAQIFSTKPTVTAIDSIGDDIEEVIL